MITSPRARGVALAMLLLIYTFNFVDRQIVGILAPAIKADLRLTDTELGLLGGLAFALLYSTLAIPFAAIADRTSRSWVITASLAVWSGFTVLCGYAGSFAQLFCFRLGVGIGEAGGVAPSYALIADSFPAARRARALAIYNLGIPLGSAAGVTFGAHVAASVNWRTAFVVVGLAGLAVAPLFRLLVREPVRNTVAMPAREPAGRVFAILAAKRSFWLMALGAATASMMGYGLAFWLPSLLVRSFALTLPQVGWVYGTLLLVGGGMGVLAGGWLGDRLGARDKAMYARVPAIGFWIAVPLFAAGMLSSDWRVALAFWLVPQALVYLWLSSVIAAVQHLVPAHMRATASACFLLINNLIGLGVGTLVLGSASDALTPWVGAEALRYAMLGGLALYLLAGGLMWRAGPALRREWVEAVVSA